MFLDFFFDLVKFGKPKFTVSSTIFFNWLFVCILNAQFKPITIYHLRFFVKMLWT